VTRTKGGKTRSTSARKGGRAKLTFAAVTPDRWNDLAELFGKRGACAGCWCMWWRLTASEFERRKGASNRRAMKRIVDTGQVPGILAYDGETPVGWCAVAPRERYPRLERSRILAPVDDTPVWSVACFFIRKEYRGMGVSTALLREVIAHVRRSGGKVVEGYPVDPKKGKIPAAFAWYGVATAFTEAGFKECARRSETRPIMRYRIRGGGR